MEPEVKILLTVDSSQPTNDKEFLQEIKSELFGELGEVDGIAELNYVTTNSPHGAKGLTALDGDIFLKFAKFGGISALASIITTWLSRDKSRTIKLKIGDNSLELTGLSKVEQKEIIDWFQIQAGLRFNK